MMSQVQQLETRRQPRSNLVQNNLLLICTNYASCYSCLFFFFHIIMRTLGLFTNTTIIVTVNNIKCVFQNI